MCCRLQDSRQAILDELSKKEKELDSLNSELAKYKECDPEVLEAMRREAVVAKEAANRWTGERFLIHTVVLYPIGEFVPSCRRIAYIIACF